MGGINMPTEECAVLYIGLALSMAQKVRAVYRHLPEPLRYQLVEAAVVHECWDSQRRERQRLQMPARRDAMYAVEAATYLGAIGNSGAHHLIEARDDFRYVITVPRGLWVETLPATEVICCEAARLLGLTVPTSAIVAVEQSLLRRIDLNCGPWGRPKRRDKFVPCCGFRYVEGPEKAATVFDPRANKAIAAQTIGRLVFNLWVQNFRSTRLAVLHDDSLRADRIEFFDHSRCLSGADWNRFMRTAYLADACPRIHLTEDDDREIRRWIRRVMEIDMSPLWQLVFDMPPAWYGSQRPRLAEVIETLEQRKYQLGRAIDTIVDSPTRSWPRKKPCQSAKGCPSELACMLSVPSV